MQNHEIDALDAELDAIVHRTKRAAKKPARARDPLDDLWESARAVPIKPAVWHAVGSACLMNMQDCTMCGTTSRSFVGWFTVQRHATDPTARRLVSGRTSGLPAHVEWHVLPATEWCPACAESQLAIESIAGAPSCP